MKIFRSVLSGLAAFICLSSIIGLVYLFTLQATILDRTVVKSWLSDSKVYEGNLIASLIQPAETPTTQTAINATPDMIKTALTATFTPGYIREQTEIVIDNTYDWVEGDTTDFSFSVPIDQKRDTFIQQLAKSLEPQIATLPVCGTPQTTTCRPANISVEQLAAQITTQSVGESGTFTAPITPATFTQPAEQSTTLPLSDLPALRKVADLLFVILPIIIILSALAAVYIMQADQRMRIAIKLSRRVFFSMLLTSVATLFVLFILSNNYYDLTKLFAAQIGDVIVPLIKVIIIDIAINLAIFSGAASVVATIAWIVLHYLQQKNTTPLPPSQSASPYRY